jgi:NAD(P)H dehydrogenase (quinone)
MIAITGANGNLGTATISFLLNKVNPAQIIAVVRDPSKMQEFADKGIQVRKADYDDVESLKNAFKGVNKLLQISAASMGPEAARQELNVVEAAKAQGVKHIVYTSTLSPHNNAFFAAGRTCFQTEQAIEDSGISYTFFRNSMYMETIPLFIGSAMEDGQIFYPTETGKVSFVSRIDIAEALSNVLTENGHKNTVYDITGTEALSFADIAGLLKSELGLPASFNLIPLAIYREELEKLNMPEEIVIFYMSIANSIKAKEFTPVSDVLEQLLGKQRKSLREYFAEFAGYTFAPLEEADHN